MSSKLICNIDNAVEVLEVPGMSGYSFNALGESNLPLAVELARIQSKLFRKAELTPSEEKLWERVRIT